MPKPQTPAAAMTACARCCRRRRRSRSALPPLASPKHAPQHAQTATLPVSHPLLTQQQHVKTTHRNHHRHQKNQVGANISDQQGLVGLDLDRGALKVGYDVKRRDLALQFTHKGDGGSTIKVRQVVPGMKWEVVPTPVVELSTRLLDQGKWRDSLKLTYDFMNRNGE